MLQEMRKKRGMTQKELAEKSGVSIRMIQSYESSDRDINKASAETVYRLAITLGCRFDEVMNIEI